jgi:hypothetical protein
MSEDEGNVEAEAAAFVDAALRVQKKQADILIEIAKRGELFHTPDGVAYADIYRNGHRETYPVRSGDFKKWLQLCYYNENDDSAPSKDALSSAIGVIEAQASFSGKEHPVAVRVGGHDRRIYLDLCNDDWQAIEVDADGWRLVDQSPIRFIRSSGMLPLPMPVKGGKTKDGVNALRKFINIKEGDDFALVKAWVLGTLYDHGPYPVLALIAQHGAAKSTILKILRALIDPNSGDLRSPPRNPDDLYIAASRSHLLPIDNVSSLPEWLSDALCRIATGMSYSKRMLFTDHDEILIRATRPIALTSVVEVIVAPDFGDRSIMLVPPKIEEKTRREEAEVLADFEKERPAILAAFLDAAAHGLKTLPDVKGKWPRMADFAKWATACEGAHDAPGTFLKAYSENRLRAINAMVGEDIVANAIAKLVLPWSGNAVTLLEKLTQLAGEQVKSHEWPKTPRKLSGILRRLVPPLHETGIDVEPPGEADKTRTWHIQAVGADIPPDGPEPPDGNPLKTQPLGDVGGLGDTLHTPGGGDPSPNEAAPPANGKRPPEPPEPPDTAETVNGGNGLDFGRSPGGNPAGNGQPPEPDMRCAHCQRPTDGTLAFGEVWLHRQCLAAWQSNLHNQEASDKERA